jgi:hypothetical protein
MELVNRETNFNKVFSASPNVGVLNPLDAKVNNLKSSLDFLSKDFLPLVFKDRIIMKLTMHLRHDISVKR